MTQSAPPRARQPGPYRNPAPIPTQSGPEGIRFDFNFGPRVQVPAGRWRVRIIDRETGLTLTNEAASDETVLGTHRYVRPVTLEVSRDDVVLFTHEWSLRDRKVMIQFPVGSLGDVIAWLPYAARFQARHGCHLTCAMGEALIPLFAGAYPQIAFVTQDQVEDEGLVADVYASHYLGLFFDDAALVWRPCEFRQVGLADIAGYILDLPIQPDPPRIALPDTTRPIPERYVCIAAQSSNQAKYWNNPTGWRELVAFLKDAGYRVICIDREATYGTRMVWNHIPYGAEDQTGDRPLAERARWLHHADFFIGLASGLSWLAWAMRRPVVMISGFSHPLTEFATPYRVINYTVCNSCWNDPKYLFPHKDFFWCPRLIGTDREFECTKQITSRQVIRTVQRVPGFGGAATGGEGGQDRLASRA